MRTLWPSYFETALWKLGVSRSAPSVRAHSVFSLLPETRAWKQDVDNRSGSAPCDLVMVGACHSAPVQACGMHNTEGEA